MLQKILLFLAFYLPFQMALNLRPGIDLASIRLLILIVFFLWLADSLRRKKIIVSNNPQTILISIFLFLNLLSFFSPETRTGQPKTAFSFLGLSDLLRFFSRHSKKSSSNEGF
jgi:hypothetical protein